jgi:heavy metal sensor kinase
MGQPSIRVRLTLAYTIAFGILLGLLSISLYRTAAAQLYAQADAQIEEGATVVRPLFNVSHSQVTWLVDKKVVDQSTYLLAHAIFDDQGQYLDGSNLASVYNPRFTDAARRAVATRSPAWETLVVQNSHKLRMFNATITGSDGRMYLFRVGMLLDQSEDDLRRLAASLAVLVPLVLLLGGGVGWVLAGDALRPVAEITATAQQISASKLAERLPLRGTGDELDRLSATLNEMITRLQGSFEQMNQFISNVSHELRTPLAALRGSCEIALRNAKSEEECRAVLASNIEDLDRLARFVSDLLALARAEVGQRLLKLRTENLTELVRDAVESTRPLAAEHGISIHYQADGEILADVDPEHVLRLLINLLDNAIKYNRPNGRVEVRLGTDNRWVVISVTDTGAGIVPGDLPRIFDRSYRGQNERDGNIGGTGLGLSLANWVATAHGGRIDVESQVGQGSTFRLWLPKIGVNVPSQSAGELPQPHTLGVAEASEVLNSIQTKVQAAALPERNSTMLQHTVRWGYWLGMACALIALVWRGLVALGLPGRFQYSTVRSVGYPGFLNGAFLFLLIAAATAGYLWVNEKKP